MDDLISGDSKHTNFIDVSPNRETHADRRIVVQKLGTPHSQAILLAYEGERAVAEFIARIGQLQGRKEQRDDHRTPEGKYQVCVKNPKSHFHRSLGLNYPNLEDARRALARHSARREKVGGQDACKQEVIPGEVDQSMFRRIADAQITHGGSDWSTPLGGEVYIHGDDPGDADKQHTRGCICLRDPDMDWLFEFTTVGTPVLILPPPSLG